uniref:Cytochrome P450 monooxygenase ALT8 n=1 Tax=Alternaria alternata TaxID=5599 RepID=ALT8_ALTAL|nr:RecName: Full=Cytochrome P450 monooxygenase ALT8; AltName: Full=AAL-toxin biosynthesis cluster protein 8 [Alternaria alternata]BBG74272.1 cytochrome P450 monooxygenase [Alternaria alternata]
MATLACVGAAAMACALAVYLGDTTKSMSYLSYSGTILFGCSGLWYVWKGLLWPAYFSPLRHLKTVPKSGWLSAETLRLYTEPRGVPQCEWINKLDSVPQGLVRYRSILGFERLLVVSPEALADVLVNRSYEFQKPAFVVTQLEQILGRGVLLAEGNEHRAQRRVLLPAFAFRHVKSLYPVMWSVAEHLITSMTENIRVESSASPTEPVFSSDEPQAKHKHEMITVNIADLCSRATLDIIGIAGIGQEFGAIRNPNNALHQTYCEIFQPSKEATLLGVLRLLLPIWFVDWLPSRRNARVQRAVQTIRSLCRQIIQEERLPQAVDESHSEVASTGKNILTLAIASGAFTDEALVDQIMTFLAAGHETTATALTWAIYIMCLHPGIQEKLRNEVRSRLPKLPSTYNSAPQNLAKTIDTGMPYLNAVCQEVFRYFPPIPVTFREATKNTFILNTAVPAGTKIVLAPRVTNRQSTLWGSNAQEFDPDRWLCLKKQDASIDDSSAASPSFGGSGKRKSQYTDTHKEPSTRSNFATMTFLHGPRSCIGQSFAKAELAILLAALVGRFEFKLARGTPEKEIDVRVSRGATARPEKGLFVQIRVIEGW